MDRKNVIKSLELCADGHHCHECSYQTVKHNLDGIADCTTLLADHALELLKKQQEEITLMKIVYGDQGEIVGELIRCKDCKWWNSNLGEICDRGHGYPGADWFCADGERRTD